MSGLMRFLSSSPVAYSSKAGGKESNLTGNFGDEMSVLSVCLVSSFACLLALPACSRRAIYSLFINHLEPEKKEDPVSSNTTKQNLEVSYGRYLVFRRAPVLDASISAISACRSALFCSASLLSVPGPRLCVYPFFWTPDAVSRSPTWSSVASTLGAYPRDKQEAIDHPSRQIN